VQDAFFFAIPTAINERGAQKQSGRRAERGVKQGSDDCRNSRTALAVQSENRKKKKAAKRLYAPEKLLVSIVARHGETDRRFLDVGEKTVTGMAGLGEGGRRAWRVGRLQLLPWS